MRTSVWAVMMVKNEEDIIGYTMTHLINEGIDGMVIAENNSSDNTLKIIHEIRNNSHIPISVVLDTEKAMLQSQKTTVLARIAHDKGAEIIYPVDADELIQSNDGESAIQWIRKELEGATHDMMIMGWRYHYRTTMDDNTQDNPYLAMKWAHKNYYPLGKIAYRYNPEYIIDQGNHLLKDSSGFNVEGHVSGNLEIRHFPYRSVKQFVQKIKQGGEAYEAAGDRVSKKYGVQWRDWYRNWKIHGDKFLHEVFLTQFYKQNPSQQELIYSPAKYRREHV